MNLLNKKQRSQALAWLSVCGFNTPTLAEYYGLTNEQMVSELKTARAEREKAGKSTEPVPVVPGNGQERPDHETVLLNALNSLEQIVWTLDNLAPGSAINESRYLATKAIKYAGRIIQ